MGSVPTAPSVLANVGINDLRVDKKSFKLLFYFGFSYELWDESTKTRLESHRDSRVPFTQEKEKRPGELKITLRGEPKCSRRYFMNEQIFRLS